VTGAPEDWPRWAVLLPHVLAATGHFKPLPGPQDQPGREDDWWLLDRAAAYLQVRARLAKARPLAERALAITEAAHGPDHRTVAVLRANLGLLSLEIGSSAAAAGTGQCGIRMRRCCSPMGPGTGPGDRLAPGRTTCGSSTAPGRTASPADTCTTPAYIHPV
jgi:hypothetical protein